MAHCLLWYKQFQKDPGFCGISKASQRDIARYLDVVHELTEMGLPEDQVLTLLPSSVLKISGIYSLLPESQPRKELKSKIYDLIANKKKMSGRIIRHLSGIDNWDEQFIDKNCKVDGGRWKGNLKTNLLSKIVNRQNNRSSQLNTGDRNVGGAQERIRYIYRINSHGQTNILETMNTAGYGEDIYGAYCIALKWASERLEAEKKEKGDNT
jgi:hypothetical protein